MTQPILGVILAGGQARRMGGGDKALQSFDGRPLLARIVERLAPQVDAIAISANGDPARFAGFGLPVIADSLPDFAGPLAGVLAGLDRARQQRPAVTDIVTVPGDAPFLPRDLVARLLAARSVTNADSAAADLACAASAGRQHPVIGLWPLRLRDDLYQALAVDGIRKVAAWTARHRLAVADFPVDPVDPFFNVNTPADLDEARRLLMLPGATR